MDSDFPSGSGGMSGASAVEEDFSKMSLDDRLVSKTWKARVHGYEELAHLFEKSPSDSAPIFKPYTRNPEAIKAIVIDSNAVAQEKGLEAIKAFLLYGGKGAGMTRETVMPSVVDKCFGAMRAGTKKAALEIVQLYAEMEDVLGCEGLTQDILKGTAAKQPKIVATSVQALCELIRDYGPKQVSPKSTIKKLTDLFGHSDKNVRAEATNLAKELHKWIGAALEPTISSLKEIQAKELREQFTQLDQAGEKATSPSRYLTSLKPAEEANSGDAAVNVSAVAGEGAAEAQSDEIDPLEFADPIDPLKLKAWPENFDEMIASTKWLERKEILDQCLKVLESTPKMIHTLPIDSIIDIFCEKVKKDLNINVALAACQCLTRLAIGLRGDFAKNKDKALPALLEKLKEKKESTIKIVSETLDAVFQTTTLSDILEQTLNASKHKNPAVKAGSIQFLARCLRETKQMPGKGDIKPIAEALVIAMGDGSADVREAGAQGLGTLMKLIGERPMNQYIDSLDEIKKGKIQEQFVSATVKIKNTSSSSGPTAASRPTGAKAAASISISRPIHVLSSIATVAPQKKIIQPASSSPLGEKENVSPSVKNFNENSVPARLAVKRPVPNAPVPRITPVASSSRPAAAAAAAAAAFRPAAASNGPLKAGKGVSAASASDPIKYRFHPEEAESKASEVVPSQIIEELSNSVWKDRLAGMTEFNNWLKLEVGEVESELIVRFLSKKPGWKESNFQVMAEVYSSLRMLAQECSTFARSSVALSIAPLCEKLGDMKLKGPAGETLTLFAEKTSFGFVLMQALTPLASIKAPKAIADSLVWVNESILAFGTSGIDVKSLIEYLLTCLKSANAGVRTNATTVFGTLSRFLGTALTTFLGDINAQLKATIEAEIDKASKDPPPAPFRFSEEQQVRGGLSASNEGGGSGRGAAVSSVDKDALDALIPRVDLDSIIPSMAITKIGDANWKERKEGLEEINALLDAHTRLKANMGEVGSALKLRYSDNNIQVRMLALDAISKIASGMNKSFADHARNFVTPVTQILADAKMTIRAAASKTLTVFAQQVGVAPLIPGFCSVLESKVANPMLKQDLFNWLGERFEEHPPEKGMELNGLALPVLVCLDDKLAALRKAALSLLPFIIMRAGYKYVMEQTNGLKTASRNTVIPLIEAAKAQAMAKTPKGAAASTTPTVMQNPKIATANFKTPNIIKRTAAISSDESNSTAPSEPPSATPRKEMIKQTSAVARALKPPSSASIRGPLISSQSSTSTAPRISIAARRTTTHAPTISSSQLQDGIKEAPFVSRDVKFKNLREKKEASNRNATWIGPEAIPRPDLIEILRSQCDHHLGSNLIDSMFSKDHNAERDYLNALTVMIDYISDPSTAAKEDYDLDINEAIARIVANSDLIFKYTAIRLTDNNTSISLKCMDLLEHLLALLRTQEYHMSDYEANCIVPCLIAKFGDPRAAFRDRIRQELFRKLTFIYPPSKILIHYMEEGLPSKNARVRTECLGELGHLFSKNGAQICSLPRVLPQIAQHISDRDNGVRTAALLAIGEVYKIVGEEETMKCVGKLPLKESGLLSERLKRTAAPSFRSLPATSQSPSSDSNRMPPPSSAPALLSAVGGRNAEMIQSQPRKLPIPSKLVRPTSMALSGIQPPSNNKGSRLPMMGGAGNISGIARPGTIRSVGSVGAAPSSAQSSSSSPIRQVANSNGGPHTRKASATSASETGSVFSTPGISRNRPSIAPSVEEDSAVEQTISEILSSDPERSLAALNQIDIDIQNLVPSLLHQADQLTIAYGRQLHRAFNLERGIAGNERLIKNILVTGTNIYDNTRLWICEDGQQKTLGSFVCKQALISLLTEVLQRLNETIGSVNDEAQSNGRYFNIIAMRSLASCNPNVVFGACLAMLTEATEDLEELQEKGDEKIFRKRIKYANMIIKCLFKVMRKLDAGLQEETIDATILLQDLERFLQVIPPSEWKRRANLGTGLHIGGKPLQIVKFVITQIVRCFGEEAFYLLKGISNAEESHVYRYLTKFSNTAPVDEFDEGLEEEESPIISASPRFNNKSQQGDYHLKRVTSMSPGRSPSIDRLSSRSSPFAAPNDADVAINIELRGIFDRIAQKSESRAAIKDLYLFQRRYPHKEANIQRSLESTGPIFQKFIKRALANHAAEDEGNHDVINGADDSGSTYSSSVMPEKRDSMASLNSARTSAAIDWPATAASLNRSSIMTPNASSQRGSYAGLGIGLNAASPTTINGGSPSFAQRRESTNDDRLAQLRAKFARSTSGTSEASVG